MAGINFSKAGAGPALIFIHGFPMNHHVWDDFVPEFSGSFTVYTPDLPGFGQSPNMPSGFSIADVAGVLNEWVSAQAIHEAVILGHSLGGYVSLEMIRQAAQLYSGLVLFHSTALADSEEKKDSRSKVLQFVREHGVLSFTSNFIEPLFHDPRHPAVEKVRALCVQSGEAAVLGYTQAMRDRRDNTVILRSFDKPVLLVGGEYDKAIPVDTLKEQSQLNEKIGLAVLARTGHMGMFESAVEASRIIRDFLTGISPES